MALLALVCDNHHDLFAYEIGGLATRGAMACDDVFTVDFVLELINIVSIFLFTEGTYSFFPACQEDPLS